MKYESGRTMLEMMLVLALIGLLSVGSIQAYKSAQAQNDANKIAELVSIASLKGLTRMKNYDNMAIWNAIGKDKSDYACINSMSVENDGKVKIDFKGCEKIKRMLINQWGVYNKKEKRPHGWDADHNTYIPIKDDMNGL